MTCERILRIFTDAYAIPVSTYKFMRLSRDQAVLFWAKGFRRCWDYDRGQWTTACSRWLSVSQILHLSNSLTFTWISLYILNFVLSVFCKTCNSWIDRKPKNFATHSSYINNGIVHNISIQHTNGYGSKLQRDNKNSSHCLIAKIPK